ncbi:hypothetical protein PRZ48_007755 [Zasmidium cellare]|uniref:G domain-containing protein n=1 Tax=Zasmidium cellare TaxID=395010 RepID=A0ABR0ELB0_ZASCE|nr:hypothetical protein PRZ48_007755 [Zasmidium cellare]
MEEEEVQASDVYIAVVGMTGAGKSYFTTQCTGEPPIHIGHGLESFTKRTTVHTMERSGKTVHLVDTPGFGDTYRSDEDVFLEIAYTLIKAYEFGIRVSGIVCLQPIIDLRVTGTVRRSLEMLQALCGPDALASVALVANRCGEIDFETRMQRMQELKSKPYFWKDFCDNGSEVFEIEAGREACLSVLDRIIEKGQTYSLRFQEQVVENKMKISDTDAGKAVFSSTSAAMQDLRGELADLRQELDVALKEKQEAAVVELGNSVQLTKDQLDARNQQVESLNTSAEVLKAEWDNRYDEEKQQMSTRIDELENIIRGLNQKLSTEASSPPSYQETLERIQEAQQERFEVASVQSLQLSRKNLKAARGSHAAGWVGAVAGLGSLAIAAAPLALMCSIM